MAGSISLLHEAVRLEANRENFKALTKYLGALAAVSHALLELCENGADALYTSVFEEKIGVVGRCYERIHALFADLTKPEPPTVTTVASASLILSAAANMRNGFNNDVRRNSYHSTSAPAPEQKSASKRNVYENVQQPENRIFVRKTVSSGQQARRWSKRYRNYQTLPNGKVDKYDREGLRKSESEEYRFPPLPLLPSTSTESISAAAAALAPFHRQRRESMSKLDTLAPSAQPLSYLPTNARASRAKLGHNSNFGTILTTLHLQQTAPSSVFYDVPTPAQAIFERSPYHQTLGGEYDSDIEAERELPNLQDIIGLDVVRHLPDKERRRQQAIIELFHIERTHVGRLKVMYRVFYKPLTQNQILLRSFVDMLPFNMLQLLFANIEEVLQVHMAINRAMKSVLKERKVVMGVGDLMLNFLTNEAGDQLKNAAVTFCQHQQYALDMLKVKRKEEKKFHAFLEKAENNPMCRGFPLRDLLPGEMKHLSRYPLLLENVLKYTPEHWDETWKLRRCVQYAKEILHAVNIAKRIFDNTRKLNEINQRLDMHPFYATDHPTVADYPNFDLTKHDLVHEGCLKWRIGKKTVDVHAIVLDSVLVLLTLTDYDRYRLMFYEMRSVNAAKESTFGRSKKQGPVKLSPLLELCKLSIRSGLGNDPLFYLCIKTPAGGLTYELVAPSVHEGRNWAKIINEQIEICKREDNLFSPAPQRKFRNSAGAVDSENLSHSSTSVETTRTFSSGNESQENFYERIDCSSCESDMDDRDQFHSADRTESIYDTVPGEDSGAQVADDDDSVFENIDDEEEDQAPTVPAPEAPLDGQNLMAQLKTYEQAIVDNMRKRQRVLECIFGLPEDDFTMVADLIASFRGSKTVCEYVLLTIDQVNKLLTLLCAGDSSHTNQSSANVTHVSNVITLASKAGARDSIADEPAGKQRRHSLLGEITWVHRCLAPGLVPCALSLMKHTSSLLQCLQSSNASSQFPIQPISSMNHKSQSDYENVQMKF